MEFRPNRPEESTSCGARATPVGGCTSRRDLLIALKCGLGATTCRVLGTNVLLTFTRVRYTVSRLTQSVAPPSLMWMRTSYLERFPRTKAYELNMGGRERSQWRRSQRLDPSFRPRLSGQTTYTPRQNRHEYSASSSSMMIRRCETDAAVYSGWTAIPSP